MINQLPKPNNQNKWRSKYKLYFIIYNDENKICLNYKFVKIIKNHNNIVRNIFMKKSIENIDI